MLFCRRTYLDYAAGVSGNPGSPHTEGRIEKERLEAARTRVARVLQVKADDVVFTSGATEANALAILGVVRAAQLSGITHPHVLYLPSAHASVIENVRLLSREGVRTEALPLRGTAVNVAALAGLLKKETVLVTMDAVCGETGVVWNTREVRTALDAARARIGDAPIVLHLDASQAPLGGVCTRAHFGADLLTFDGAKVAGEHRVGCLSAPRTIPLKPLYRGGGQERGVRPGTEDARGAEVFAEGLERAQAAYPRFAARARADRARLVNRITSALSHVYINESVERQAPHLLNFSFIGRDTDYLVALLDEAGFAVSTKSACETDSEEGSRAIFALFGDKARAESTLRVSWSPSISRAALARFGAALIGAVRFVDSRGSR